MSLNAKSNYIFTSESVSKGHPDKVADQISDAILDAALKAGDETTRVACETLVTTDTVVLAGEVKNFNVSDKEVEAIVRVVIHRIGYTQAGFHHATVQIHNLLHQQSGDIALGTDDFGAGDQGIMFGYATNETPSYMPAPIHYAHAILKELDDLREKYPLILGPDAKSQVSIQYLNGKPSHATAVVVSTQHAEGKGEQAKALARGAVVSSLGRLYRPNETVLHLNPTGNFVVGGPDGDAGLTGRKIIVDTYGGKAPHGGGAFSGKDGTKVDRSAAYMARWIAKNAVAKGWTPECEIQLSYAIGIKEPMAVYIKTPQNEHLIREWINTLDLTPLGIIRRFDLFNFTRYSDSCVYGHFGNKNVPWEQLEAE